MGAFGGAVALPAFGQNVLHFLQQAAGIAGLRDEPVYVDVFEERFHVGARGEDQHGVAGFALRRGDLFKERQAAHVGHPDVEDG